MENVQPISFHIDCALTILNLVKFVRVHQSGQVWKDEKNSVLRTVAVQHPGRNDFISVAYFQGPQVNCLQSHFPDWYVEESHKSSVMNGIVNKKNMKYL